MPKPIAFNIEAIIFDVNGTLRIREPHEPTQRAAFSRMLELLGKQNDFGYRLGGIDPASKGIQRVGTGEV